MAEQRFPADGVVCIMIWKKDEDGAEAPYLRIYDPCDPTNGHALNKPDGSYPSFKDYQLRWMVDPSFKIIDKMGSFEFVESDDGDCYFDFSLKVLGRAR